MTIVLIPMDQDPGEDMAEVPINKTTWSEVIDIARDYGWNPAGTLPSASTDTHGRDWPGTYQSSDYQIITAEDGAAMASAIERYLTILRDVAKVLRSGRVTIA